MNLIKVNAMPSIFNTMDGVVDGLFNDHGYARSKNPKYNVVENEKDYSIFMEIPGVEKDTISIECDNDMLAVSNKEGYGEDSEVGFNSFTNLEIDKSFHLPEDIDSKKISAQLKNGILEIKIPRKIPIKTKAKKIAIK